MADIKNYIKEKEKRHTSREDYKEKIRKHKMAGVYRVLIVLAIVAALGTIVAVQYKRHVYTGYDVVASQIRDTAEEATDVRLANSVFTYSNDGAHCTDIKGNVTWNQTYEIQDVKLASNGNVVAIGNYNGRDIYVQSTQEQLGKFTTTMPIRNLTVSAAGRVSAVLADTDVTWINTYDAKGELLYYSQTHMQNSGYPAALSLSPNGELLAVSYVYVDAGIVKTNVAFYNFGPVGANQSDFLVSAHTYQDMLVPQVQFMNDSAAFAVGDNRLMIYVGDQKPVSAAEYLYDDEVQAVFYNENYVGLVFASDKAEHKYRMNVYNTEAKEVGRYYFDMEYTDIFFEKDQFVVYNETECLIMTFKEDIKYEGLFSKTVNLMIPTDRAYRYVLVSDQSIDVVQLK